MANDLSPHAASLLICSDVQIAAVFWDNVNHLGLLSCKDRIAALRHVALCPACAARLVTASEPDVEALSEPQHIARG